MMLYQMELMWILKHITVWLGLDPMPERMQIQKTNWASAIKIDLSLGLSQHIINHVNYSRLGHDQLMPKDGLVVLVLQYSNYKLAHSRPLIQHELCGQGKFRQTSQFGASYTTQQAQTRSGSSENRHLKTSRAQILRRFSAKVGQSAR